MAIDDSDQRDHLERPRGDALDNPEATDRSLSRQVLTSIIAGVFLLWVGLGWILPSILTDSWVELGQLGDSFGLVNSLFAGLAFAGVIGAILLQREELRLQRKELELTREELSRQGAALEAQVAGAARQRFDSTFFQMVRLHGDIVDGVSYLWGR